jgi:uncharacterized protein YrrD
MLQLSAFLLNRPVLSLRAGTEIATTTTAIINPNNLKIEGFYCHDPRQKRQAVLLSQDIRDVLPQGLVVNDYDALTDADELVRLKDLLELGFELLGMPVVTVSKHKLGKVNDFASDNQTLYIQKIYVTQSILKSLSNNQLGIDRNQIIEITNKKIVVKDLVQPTPATVSTGLSIA